MIDPRIRPRRQRPANPPQNQLSFADAGSADWPLRPGPRPAEQRPLAEALREETRAFERTRVDQGKNTTGSALSYRKAVVLAVKQAERALGRQLSSVNAMFEDATIAAVAGDDQPMEGERPLSRNTMHQRRVALNAYAKSVGVPGMTYEEATEVLDRGFQAAAEPRGLGYAIRKGRRPDRHYRPPQADVEKVIRLAAAMTASFIGPRNAALLAVGLYTGRRASTVLAIDGAHFSARHGQLFVLLKEKGRAHRQEIEVPPELVPYLARYVDAFNGYAAARGWPHRIGIGVAGPFWRAETGRPLTYPGLLAVVRTYTRLAGVKPFVFHGLRHLHAGVLGDRLSVEDAALAGGWKNPGVFLRHYARPLFGWGPEETGPEPPNDCGKGGDPSGDPAHPVRRRPAG